MSPQPPELKEALALSQDQFVWEAPIRLSHARGPRWYLFMAVIALLFVAYAVWTANFLFAFIILLASIILILAGNEPSKQVLIQIGEHGLVRDGKLYPYQDLGQFAIIYHPPFTKVLYIDHRNPLIPRLRIHLEDQDPVEVREYLKQFMREDLDLQDEHLSDMIGRLLKI